eukprot:COSAG01_NODE_3487_length_6017_cov_6.010814_6_plen_82_part_00
MYRNMHFAEIASAACNSSSIASPESHESQEAHTVVLIPSDAAGFYCAVEMYRYMYRTAVPCHTCTAAWSRCPVRSAPTGSR